MALVLMAFLSSTALARKSYLVKLEHKDKTPHLRQTYPEYVVFENNDDSFKIQYQGAVAAGWEWTQTMTED